MQNLVEYIKEKQPRIKVNNQEEYDSVRAFFSSLGFKLGKNLWEFNPNPKYVGYYTTDNYEVTSWSLERNYCLNFTSFSDFLLNWNKEKKKVVDLGGGYSAEVGARLTISGPDIKSFEVERGIVDEILNRKCRTIQEWIEGGNISLGFYNKEHWTAIVEFFKILGFKNGLIYHFPEGKIYIGKDKSLVQSSCYADATFNILNALLGDWADYNKPIKVGPYEVEFLAHEYKIGCRHISRATLEAIADLIRTA